MVSFPYPKLMNANDRVDQGAAFILCSLSAARHAGVPEDRWVFPVAGTDAHDHWFLSNRQDLRSSPAISIAGARALTLAGAGIDDVAHVDLYSCFPCAVQIAAGELGLPLDDPGRSLTVTGGLGFAGGPGNNYVTHSIASMARAPARRPRHARPRHGLGVVQHEARHRGVVHHTARRRIPLRMPAGRGGRRSRSALPPPITRATPPSRPTPSSTTAAGSPSSPSWPF